MSNPFRLALCGLLLAAAASFADDVEPPGVKADLRKLAGTYRVILFERDGQRWAEADIKTMKVVLDKEGNATFAHGNDAFTSRLTISPSKKPREVDCVYTNGPWKGVMLKGIYRFDKDGLSCCYAEPGKARPVKFETGRDTGWTLYSLERVKDK